MKLRIANIVGARPQFVKLGPLCRAIDAINAAGMHRIDNLIVHTGQHYDAAMSEVFFHEMSLPRADLDLGVGSGSQGWQTARMLEQLEQVFEQRQPDIVVTYGDTNSTLAATLAAAKLHLPLAHVEAGLRSFDRKMPEEVNRISADHLSDLLFAPTPAAMRNLAAENLAERSQQVGDVMLDAMGFNLKRARERSKVLERLGVIAGNYLVATIHRPANTDGPQLRVLLDAFNTLAREERPLVLPLHPRTADRIRKFHADWRPATALKLIDPLGPLDMIRLTDEAAIVLTDSGGLQKEAFFLGRPCVTLRPETEWIETVEEGGNVIAGADPQAIAAAVAHWERTLEAGRLDLAAGIERNFGDGGAAARILNALIDFRPRGRT